MAGSAAGRVAIVTGSGRGIGRGLALGLADEGYRLVISDLDGDSAAAVAKEIVAKGGEAISTKTDVSDVGDAEAMVAAAVDAFGAVHVLCNNAALFGADVAMFNPISWDPVDGPLEQYRKVMAVNVDSIVYCSRAAIPVMKAQKWGRIVNTSSGGVYFDIGNLYSLSKLAVNGVTRMFARAVGKDGITVNAIAPGLTITEAHYNRYASREEAESTLQAFADKEIPIGRPGRPADLFNAVRFLVSDDASYVTGHTMSIDGGWFNRV